MNRKEFSKKYCETVERTIEISKKLQKKVVYKKYEEKVLAEIADKEDYYWDLSNEFDEKTVNTRDVFEYGLQLIVDCDEWDLEADYNIREFIDKTLSNIIALEKDEYARTLKRIQKEAVLMILERKEPRLILPMLNSFTDFKLDEPFEKPPKDSLDDSLDFDILKD
ncbi:hypothetical protein R84B8_01365 [Treponema sp. R8-4-B8]